MTTVTHRRPGNRSGFYYDHEGVLTKAKRYDEVLKEKINLTNDLDGETISSTAWDTAGVTISGTATSGDDVTWTVTACGYGTLKVTTSGSRTLHYRFQWRASDRVSGDYA